MTDRPRVVVIGGGIAGLMTAYRFAHPHLSLEGRGRRDLEPMRRAGADLDVTLVEATGRLGGNIVTEAVDGFLVEGGPDSFLATKPWAVALCHELGLANHLIGTTPRAHRAFVLRAGQLHDLPEGLTGLVPTRIGPVFNSRLLSWTGRLRVGMEPFLPASRTEEDESLAAYLGRRLGVEAYQWLMEPLMSGIFAGDGTQLSVMAAFPQLKAVERAHGSLLRGMARMHRENAAGGSTRTGFLTLTGGLGELVDALSASLGDASLHLGVRASSVGFAGSHFRVRLDDDSGIDANAVVLATPSYRAAELLSDADADLAATLRAIPYGSTAAVILGYRREAVTHPLDGYGYVVPRAEGEPVLACTWMSSKFEGRAPPGCHLVRVFFGGEGRDDVLRLSDDALIELAGGELSKRLGVTGSPMLSRVFRWKDSMPQYTLGHPERVLSIDQQLERRPGLFLAGNAYRGVGIPDSIRSGELAAFGALAHLAANAAAPTPATRSLAE